MNEDHIEENIPTRINNKVKQFFGKNWGSNKTVKKNTEIKPLKVVRLKNKKKKKKKVWRWEKHFCPFCDEELAIAKAVVKETESWKVSFFGEPRVKECTCGAAEVEDCPCCHRKTWFKDNIYRHQKSYGCGFEGERINGVM